ncbi:hypothetical protein OF83DRAFT_1055129 [Amylostereum chailletii]|nr:hypothetical protein OF83DRAFT_1055129 [Amylostereum chailletii]
MSPAVGLPFPSIAKIHERIAQQTLTRRGRFVVIAVGAAFLYFLYSSIVLDRTEKPPTYREWHQKELALPQNNPDLRYPQGRFGKYVRFSNHVTHLGWGNAMQEMIMNAHVAYKADRTFVFYNYTWDVHGEYSRFGSGLTPSRIPITAFAAGPIAGDEFPPSYNTPPAVAFEFFDEVCTKRTIIEIDPSKGDLAWASATTIIDHYVARLRHTPDNCVEFVNKPMFDYMLFGDAGRISTVWPELMNSPILTQWAWSSLVVSGVETNHELIHPSLEHAADTSALSGLIALHIRRGDFKDHCKYLTKFRSSYNGFNVRSDFNDQYSLPEEETELEAFYDAHCFPDIPEIVTKVLGVRRALGGSPDRIYVLTNAQPDWLKKLERALRDEAGWMSITTSRDLQITPEQKFVSQAMDMLIASRAQAFVGNAFSSLTSNVNLLRVAQGHSPSTTYFW